MSTVKVTNLVHPSSSSTNIQLGSDGSVVLPAGFTGGIGSNVVQAVKTDTFTTTSDTFTTVTGLSTSITPTSATSKVLIIAQVSHGLTSSSNWGAYKITRGGTDIYRGAAEGSRIQALFGGRLLADLQKTITASTVVYLDSPATTSSTTYQVEAKRLNSVGAVYVNRPEIDTNSAEIIRAASSITAIEVAA